ncbi:MAG TPA: helix-turn-helix transcriptional regulator [Actinomycetota bacterium]|nr:helix-turn-helix transcriptional regulator [Actinomycetota bacterium]
MLLLNAGEPYRCTHELRIPSDRNLCLELDAPSDFHFERTWVPFSPRWASVLTWMAREERAAEHGYRLAVDALASSLVVDIARDPRTNGSSSMAVESARAFLDLNFRADIGLKEVAKAASISPFHLSREFKRHVGTSPRQYLIDARIREAKLLLRDTSMTVTEIADACGFNSMSHFSTTFRSRTGLSPVAFRRS